MKGVDLRLLLGHRIEVTLLAVIVIVQALGLRMLLRSDAARSSRFIRALIYSAAALSFVWIGFGFLMRFVRVSSHLPAWAGSWPRESAVTWALLTVLLVPMFAIAKLIPRPQPDHSPARRQFLTTMRVAAVAAPVAVLGYGTFVARTRIELHEESILVPGLHPDLDGIRLVQLSDIHLSPYLSVAELERAVVSIASRSCALTAGFSDASAIMKSTRASRTTPRNAAHNSACGSCAARPSLYDSAQPR
jgi:hypothetical protein